MNPSKLRFPKRIIPAAALFSVAGLAHANPEHFTPGKEVQLRFEVQDQDTVHFTVTDSTSVVHPLTISLKPDGQDDAGKRLRVTKGPAGVKLNIARDGNPDVGFKFLTYPELFKLQGGSPDRLIVPAPNVSANIAGGLRGEFRIQLPLQRLDAPAADSSQLSFPVIWRGPRASEGSQVITLGKGDWSLFVQNVPRIKKYLAIDGPKNLEVGVTLQRGKKPGASTERICTGNKGECRSYLFPSC